MFNIEEELKKLPDKPGVYLMHSKNDEIIYVGKAINLKNRVRQYFQAGRNRGPKIEKMITLISYFEYIITGSELEALVLESNLIKEHRPKYNTMLKDDKSYPFIKVTVNEEYPKVLFSRRMKRDKAKYYGPYTSVNSVKDTIELMRKLYKVRSCNKSLPKEEGKDRPCLYYHIGQCKAPCQGYISKEEYRENIEKVIEFLNGNQKEVIKELEKKMQEASEKLEFEQAAQYRDLIISAKNIIEKQRITNSSGEDKDVIAIAKAADEAVVAVFFIREGKILGREHFHMTLAEDSQREEIMTDFIKQYYSGTPYIPKELLLEVGINDEDIITQWLSERKNSKVHVTVPKKGEKHKLIDLAYENASMILRQDFEKLQLEEKRTIGAANEIASLIGIPKADRIEAFDISNTSGVINVASMVVFENGKAKRSEYRKFKLKTVKGPDDYLSMEEVLTRRFLHGIKEKEENKGANNINGKELFKDVQEKEIENSLEGFAKFPDLIMMDGGKGQVNVALRVLEELKINIPVCGMVKDDNHRTRGLYYNNTEIAFPKNNQSFALVTRIQDEAHRFAIEYHKLLRGKNQVKSVLDDIKGVGPARRKALMKYFKDISLIKEADIDTLMLAEGITRETATNIYNFFLEFP